MRLGGNLAKATWTVTTGGTAVTGEGAATLPPAINVAEFIGWDFDASWNVQDVTPLATDSPVVHVGMRRPNLIRCYMNPNSGANPEGIQRLAYRESSTGVMSPAFLRLFLDKNTTTTDYYDMSAYLVGVRQSPKSLGGLVPPVILTFVPTGAISQKSGSSAAATTIL